MPCYAILCFRYNQPIEGAGRTRIPTSIALLYPLKSGRIEPTILVLSSVEEAIVAVVRNCFTTGRKSMGFLWVSRDMN